MFENMFDFHCAAEVRNFFKVSHKPASFFYLNWECLCICIFPLVIKEDFVFFLNQVNNNGLQQRFNR